MACTEVRIARPVCIAVAGGKCCTMGVRWFERPASAHGHTITPTRIGIAESLCRTEVVFLSGSMTFSFPGIYLRLVFALEERR